MLSLPIYENPISSIKPSYLKKVLAIGTYHITKFIGFFQKLLNFSFANFIGFTYELEILQRS